MTSPTIITSIDDPRVDLYRSVRDADLRGRRHLCMAESELVVRRLLNSHLDIHSLFLSPEKYERLSPFIEESLEVYVADVSLMSSISGFHIHRGTLALAHRPAKSTASIQSIKTSLQSKDKIALLFAEGITNVDNMGTLFRNAAAFGVDAVILDSTCCDPLYRKAIRVSMGHALSVPWATTDDWIASLKEIQSELNVTLIGCETCVDAVSLWEVEQKDKFGLIMGEEKNGLSASTLSVCDEIVEIPMAPHVPSLNVGIASAVGLYEFLCRKSLNNRK